jgi:hypothetical protein
MIEIGSQLPGVAKICEVFSHGGQGMVSQAQSGLENPLGGALAGAWAGTSSWNWEKMTEGQKRAAVFFGKMQN